MAMPNTMPMLALCFSLGLNAILNLVYDFQLRKSSERINLQPVDKYMFTKKRKSFHSKTWEELEVGDIIKVYKNQELPADVLILDISGQSND
jgi:magnesium-transporting ATPase (P-type)